MFKTGGYANMDLLTFNTGESNLVILSQDHLAQAQLDNPKTFINISDADVEVKDFQNKNNSKTMKF